MEERSESDHGIVDVGGIQEHITCNYGTKELKGKSCQR